MLQQIITFIIVAFAVFLAVRKTVKKFSKKKKKTQVDFKNGKFSMQHNCSDCSAECILRDASTSLTKSHPNLCKPVPKKQD